MGTRDGGREIGEVEKRLRALIDASCDTENAWCVQHSQRRAPLQAQSPISNVFQYLEDFNAFRDDAHMAAWQPTGVTGNEWETFAFVSDGKATNAEALFDQLHYRGYTRAEFSDALTKLVWRGWLERDEGETYRVTAQGRELRAEVERKTNDFFYAPWKPLSEMDLQHLYSNLERLRDGLNAFAS